MPQHDYFITWAQPQYILYNSVLNNCVYDSYGPVQMDWSVPNSIAFFQHEIWISSFFFLFSLPSIFSFCKQCPEPKKVYAEATLIWANNNFYFQMEQWASSLNDIQINGNFTLFNKKQWVDTGFTFV